MASIADTPQALSITETPGEITILEEDGRLRALHPDGKKYAAEGGTTEVRAHWEGERLVVESSGKAGSKLLETFTLAPDRSVLTVTLKLSGRISVEVRRVYARVDDALH